MSQCQPTIALIIPTWNARQHLPSLFDCIKEQTRAPDHILFIDSSSTDGTLEYLKHSPIPITLHQIPQSNFNHGGTRQLATQLVDADLYIFMTQDAMPGTRYTFEHIIQSILSDEQIACAYGRQLPAADANPLGAHLRMFNYPSQSHTRSKKDIKQYGIKTCFNSDSFACYRKAALNAVGGFPLNSSFGEDVHLAARFILAGYKVNYCADATVIHSHNYTIRQEFNRYKAVGQFHQQESWILEHFKSPNREGWKYIASEIRYLMKTKKFYWLPRAAMSWMAKLLGYKVGKQVARKQISEQLQTESDLN